MIASSWPRLTLHIKPQHQLWNEHSTENQKRPKSSQRSENKSRETTHVGERTFRKSTNTWYHCYYRIPVRDTVWAECENAVRKSWEWRTATKWPELFRKSASWKTKAERLLQIKGDTRKRQLNAMCEHMLEHKRIMRAFIVVCYKRYWDT